MEKESHIHKVPDNLLKFKQNYCDDVAKWLLELSVVSYIDDIKELENQIATKTNFKVKKVCEKDNIEALVLYTDDVIVVSFAGTEVTEFSDINTDLQFWYSKAEGVRMHSGFYTAYKKIKFDVYRAVLELQKDKHRDVYWTGHSLGGALAVIFGTFWKEKSVIYTYGQPRVGDRDFAKRTQARADHYRVTVNADFAPKAPPKWIIGYHHSGEETRLVIEPEFISFGWITNWIRKEVITFIIAVFFRLSWFLTSFAWYARKAWIHHSMLTHRKLLWNPEQQRRHLPSETD